jgi:DNA polymerase III sliding clamp (beta) subunit (PCNA family)
MIYVNSINLKEAIKSVIKSASRDNVYLSCVNFNNRSDIFTVMASRDAGFSIFRVMDQETLKLLKLWGGEFSKSISIADAKVLLKNLKGLNTKVTITFNESEIRFDFDDHEDSYAVLETSYPRLDQLYPNTFRTSFEFNRISFLAILKSLKNDIDSKVKMKRVHIEVTDPDHEIKLSAPDAGTETRSLYFSLSGDRQSITLNIDDLINILSSVQFDTLTLGMNNKKSPIVISSPNKIFNGVVMCNAPGIFTGVSMPCVDQV